MSRTIIGSNCIDDDDAFIYLHALNLASVMLQGTSRDVSTLRHMIICHCPEFMMLVSKVADFYFHFLSTRCCNAQRLLMPFAENQAFGILDPSARVGPKWVSFCRAGILAISCHIFSKSRAFV